MRYIIVSDWRKYDREYVVIDSSRMFPLPMLQTNDYDRAVSFRDELNNEGKNNA